MVLDAVKNFAEVEVSIGYDDVAISIVLGGGDGAKLPQPSSDGQFNLVWWNSTDYPVPSDDPNKEIVRCVSRSTDTLSVTRAQEGTSASTHNIGGKTYKMILALTAKMITDISQLLSFTYGVSWDESADTYVRLGLTAGQPLAVTLSDELLPIQAQMRRCLLLDSGVVNYYLSKTNSNKKEDGVTDSVLTGADGQVMVEIPKFYYKYGYAGTTHTWQISPVPRSGFTVHPAFIKDGVEVAYRYIGAYEGILYDVSAAVYTHGYVGQVVDWVNDKLSSVSGFRPAPLGTRANYRAIAAKRGTGWRQVDYDLMCAIQLLYLVEYASFYSQSTIGAGISNVTDWAAYNNYFPIAASGNSNGIGNATGNTAGSTSCATEATKYLSYRGIENWFGHLWKFVDGININDNIPYVTNNAVLPWVDDTATGYTRLVDYLDAGVTLHNANGYPATIQKMSGGFVAASVGASSSTKITDYYYQNSGWRVACFGGAASSGANDGGFYWYLAYASASAGSNILGRLGF